MNNPGPSTSDPPQREINRVNINTSLSTLSPTHYEVMNTFTNAAQSGVPGGRALSMRDVILWQQEQAQRQGELGFTLNFPDPSELFKRFTINPSSENEPPAESRAELVTTMQETHRAIVQLHQRKIIMDGAGPLLAKTEMDVNQKLLAAGVPEHEFQGKNLRQKIVQLVELREPPPEVNFASVLVEVGSTTKSRSHVLEINLPLKVSVAEVFALLDEVVKALLSEKGLIYEKGGIWKYQLIDQSRSRLLKEKSLPLETDRDYDKMLQQVSKTGDGKTRVAVLTQGGLAKPIDTSEASENTQHRPKAKADSLNNALKVPKDKYDLPEILDEDGKPYFEPLDMDRMAEKYAALGEDLAEENGIHGFWR